MFKCNGNDQQGSFDNDETCLYSDEISSDLEDELYSMIYHLPTSNDTMIIKDESDRKYVNAHSTSTFEGEITDKSNIFSENPVCSVLDGNSRQRADDIMPFRKTFHASTPKEFHTNQASYSKKSRLKNSVISQPESIIEISDNETLSSDDSIICIDSWDSTEDNLMLNINDKNENNGSSFSNEFSNSSSSSMMSNVCNGNSSQSYIPVTIDSESSYNSSSSDDPSVVQLSKSLPANIFNSKTPRHAQKDLWHLDPEDLNSSYRKSNRYYRKSTAHCKNCRETGHSAKTCTQLKNVKCYLCGDSHVAAKCKRKVCGICFKCGHQRYRCPLDSDGIFCDLCKLPGHIDSRCPDLWRRYHLTTSGTSIVKSSRNVKDGGPKYCYNCGKKGHFGIDCIRSRLSYSLPSSPYVISYKKTTTSPNCVTPILKKKNKNSKNLQNIRLNRTEETPSTLKKKSIKKIKRKINSPISFQEQDFIRTPEIIFEEELSNRSFTKRKQKQKVFWKKQKMKKKLNKNLSN